MRALVQRVTQASVAVEGEKGEEINKGLVVFLGIAEKDGKEEARYLVDKIINLRIFSDKDGKFNHSALDTGAEFLVISQFTLYGDTRRGRRPSFVEAASSDRAEPLFLKAVDLFRATGLKVETGRFQSHMLVQISNDGPVTLMLDTADRERPRRE